MPPYGFSTDQVHAGERIDPAHGARIQPIYMTAGFQFDDADQAEDRFGAGAPGHVYTRVGNPTNEAVERRIARLEKGTGAILVGSGQAAVSVALLGILQAGDHVVAAADVYEGTKGLLTENFTRFGIETSFVENVDDLDAWRRELRPNTRLVFAESISNPRALVLDLEGVAAIAHERGLPFVVDNTLATPYLLQPIEHGADVVVHSASKYLAGHGAAIGGVIVAGGVQEWSYRSEFAHLGGATEALGGRSWIDAYGNDAYLEFTRAKIAARLGPTISPFNAFLIQQGIETLSLRVSRQSETALALAQWLQTRPEVARVDHPGLASNPSRALAQHYLPRGQGGLFSVTLRGGREAATRVLDAVGLFSRMSHLGDVRSLVLHPASTSHAHRSPEERAARGIDDGLLRLSIGLEDEADLIEDLRQALDAGAASRSTSPWVAQPADASRSTATTILPNPRSGTSSAFDEAMTIDAAVVHSYELETARLRADRHVSRAEFVR